jgi:hypothetical protein
MPQKMPVSPRFFLGPLNSAQVAPSETYIVAALQCGFSRQALSQCALKLTQKNPAFAGFPDTRDA